MPDGHAIPYMGHASHCPNQVSWWIWFQALVQAAANPPAAAEDDEDMGIALIEAVGIMISSNTAARIFAEALEPALDEHMPGPDGSQLLELTHAALSIPAVCQVNSATTPAACLQVLRRVRAGTELAYLPEHAAFHAVKNVWKINSPAVIKGRPSWLLGIMTQKFDRAPMQAISLPICHLNNNGICPAVLLRDLTKDFTAGCSRKAPAPGPGQSICPPGEPRPEATGRHRRPQLPERNHTARQQSSPGREPREPPSLPEQGQPLQALRRARQRQQQD